MLKKVFAMLTTAVIFTATASFAYAADFTPSVERKSEPAVIQTTNKDGASVDAVIRDKDGNEIASIPGGSLVVTPYSKRDQAADNIKLYLNTAFGQLSDKQLSELTANINDYLSKNSDGLTEEDVVIRDLFDVTMDQTYLDYLNTDGNTITITFDTDYAEDTFLMVMTNCDITNGDDWNIIPSENVKRNSDGSVSVTFDKMCPVVFVSDGGQVAIDPNGPSSPQTSDDMNMGIMAVVFIVAAAGGAFVVKKSKKSF